MVPGLGLEGLRFRARGFRVYGSMVQGLRFRVRVQGLGFRVRVQCSGFRV